MSWTESCYAFGNMLGPAVGAALYKIGGFKIPFFVIGGLNIVLSIALVVSIPNLKNINTNDNSHNEEDNKILIDQESSHSKPILGLVHILWIMRGALRA